MRAAPEFHRGEMQHAPVVEIQPEAMLITQRKTAVSALGLHVHNAYEYKETVAHAEGKSEVAHAPPVCEKTSS